MGCRRTRTTPGGGEAWCKEYLPAQQCHGWSCWLPLLSSPLYSFKNWCTIFRRWGFSIFSPRSSTERTGLWLTEKSSHQEQVCRHPLIDRYDNIWLHTHCSLALCMLSSGRGWCAAFRHPIITPDQSIRVGYQLELQTKVLEDYAKFYNHGEGPSPGWKRLLALSHLRHY